MPEVYFAITFTVRHGRPKYLISQRTSWVPYVVLNLLYI